jgi:RNA polymerase sigma factor (sigma-70 family)
MYLIHLFFLLYIGVASSVYLNKIAQQQIKHIIQHPGTTPEMRETVDKILFDSYKDFAAKKALQFKQSYKYICKDIKTDDFLSCAFFGLYKGIKRFNGNDTFVKYIELYIKCELQKCMSKSIPINALPKTYFQKKKTSEEYAKFYSVHMNPIHIGFDNHFMENTQYNDAFSNGNRWIGSEDDLIYQKKIWEKIHQLPEFQRNIMQRKYSVCFETLYTNREIAKTMNCSAQTISVNIKQIRNKLLQVGDENS